MFDTVEACFFDKQGLWIMQAPTWVFRVERGGEERMELVILPVVVAEVLLSGRRTSTTPSPVSACSR